MANGTDPYRNYNFTVEISGAAAGNFVECSGLGVRVEPISYREAGNQQIVRHIPGRVEYAAVTLRYGLTSSRELWDWLMATAAGRVERRNVSIAMLNSEGNQETMRWNLINAWPSEWQGAPLDALGNEIAIESLSLVFDSLERV
ncbi:MAG: phage tail protein [Anaerolineales bacterium]|nr:phage tail protein [Anaerolineales bacterium]